ncbi:MAG: Arc family DNA-binding protein [Nitrososphaerales archaeon]
MVQIPGAAHTGDLSPEGFRDLQGKRANAAGRSIDSNLLAGLQSTLVANAL